MTAPDPVDVAWPLPEPLTEQLPAVQDEPVIEPEPAAYAGFAEETPSRRRRGAHRLARRGAGRARTTYRRAVRRFGIPEHPIRALVGAGCTLVSLVADLVIVVDGLGLSDAVAWWLRAVLVVGLTTGAVAVCTALLEPEGTS